MDKVQEFKKIVDQMADTYAKKNENYGDSFGDTYERLGAISGLVRLYDKLNRATSLVNGGENHYESLEDTFIDMACYAIMNVIEIRKQKEQECSGYINREYKSNDIFGDVAEYYPNDYYECHPMRLRDIGGISYTSPCQHCQRKNVINSCDGCVHNIQITCTASDGTLPTSGGTR